MAIGIHPDFMLLMIIKYTGTSQKRKALNITDSTLYEIFICPQSEACLQDKQMSVQLYIHRKVFSPDITPQEKPHLLTPL
jgi:hypothetical protein